MDNQEDIRPVEEWPAINGRYTLTVKQQKRKNSGKSIWERDKIVEPYVYDKGEGV